MYIPFLLIYYFTNNYKNKKQEKCIRQMSGAFLGIILHTIHHTTFPTTFAYKALHHPILRRLYP